MDANLFTGILNALSFVNLGFALIGCLLGTLVGVLPGLGPASAMAILLPIAVYLPPDGAIIIMAGIYYGAMYGGSTTAILMNIPGEVSSIVTAQDGFPMTKQGRAGQALAIAAIGSFAAGILGTLAISLIGPAIADLALRFGPPEYFGLVLFSMTALISFAGNSLVLGLGIAALGMALASVGADPLTGAQRLTFGSIEFTKGLDIVPVLVGVFGIGEVLYSASMDTQKVFSGKLGSWWSMIPRGRELSAGLKAAMRGTGIGFVMGLLPGMLPALTAYLAYDVEKRVSRTPERFGNGAIEGVASPEAANNATAMAGFIPLLALGIPTSPALAIMLGTLMINGLTPGPMLFEQQGLLVWTVIGSMLLANMMLLVLNLPLVGVWAKISQIPYSVLGPIVLGVCVIGAYAPRNTLFDVWVAIGFGIVGYVMRRYHMPVAPLVLGFLLGPMFEQSLRQSLALTGGNPLFMIDRPIAFGLCLAAILVVAATAYFKTKSKVVQGLVEDSTNEA
ncbi:tripartite tricarboxylate transporter permease [Aquabacter spiritensis]|uniref:Putative tricarboxylic transport membrane protein n=1 Tax=Aquabacter spiritensis TaxID=933073 RepID=A0A4R3M0H3_9HYPH|nr:tripartite tricarboxylate transporter permease [Aquabacter spiritensis]TCT06213.1 putative tricarboxylic transport membrane protein [Aquabacter spiritensis]